LQSSPLLGEHTKEVLVSIGYDESHVNDLFENKFIGKNL